MKKTKTILLFFILLININAFSQSKKTAPDFKVIDIYGNPHILYNYLDSGKYVFLQLFSVNCATCQNEAPIIDSAYQKFGCNCNNVIFLGIDYGTTNEYVREFCENYNFTISAVSGQEGGGNSVFDLFDIGYTPYNLFIAPSREIVEENISFSTSQNIIDTILNYEPDTSECKGSDFLYYALEKSLNPFLNEDLTGVINGNEILIYFPNNFINQLSEIIPSFVSSSYSTVYIGIIEQISDTSIVNFSELNQDYNITAQDSSSKNWTLKILITEDISKTDYYINVFPNPSSGNLYFTTSQKIKTIEIFNSEFKKIKTINYTTKNYINLSDLENGLYFVQFQIDNQKITKRIIIQH